MDLVQELFLARGGGHGAPVPLTFVITTGRLPAPRRSEIRAVETVDVLAARIREVAAGHLAGALEKVAHQRAPPQLGQGVERQPKLCTSGATNSDGSAAAP